MSDQQENKTQADAKVEDLAPTEEQSADLKGGPTSVHGGGGGAGHTTTVGSGTTGAG